MDADGRVSKDASAPGLCASLERNAVPGVGVPDPSRYSGRARVRRSVPTPRSCRVGPEILRWNAASADVFGAVRAFEPLIHIKTLRRAMRDTR